MRNPFRNRVRERAERPALRWCCVPSMEWDPRVPSGMTEEYRLHREWHERMAASK